MSCYLISENNETFYAFTLSIYSSREISCSQIRPPNYANILGDALISCANKYGKKKRYSLKEKYDNISTISLNLGSGYCTVLTNHSNKHVEFQMESKANEDYSNTRGSSHTFDKLPPNHRYKSKNSFKNIIYSFYQRRIFLLKFQSSHSNPHSKGHWKVKSDFELLPAPSLRQCQSDASGWYQETARASYKHSTFRSTLTSTKLK